MLADFWGVDTQTIADFRLPIGSLSAELGRNICNWLCKPVWVASAHPWLHLSAWIAALPGSLLWLQHASHTHDTVHFSVTSVLYTDILFHFYVCFFLRLISMKTGVPVFPSVFGALDSAWHTVVTWSVFMEWVRVAFLCQNKGYFFSPSAGLYCLLFLAVSLIQTTYWSGSSGLVGHELWRLARREFGQDGKWLESWFLPLAVYATKPPNSSVGHRR